MLKNRHERLAEIDAIGEQVMRSYDDFVGQTERETESNETDSIDSNDGLTCESDLQVSFHLSRNEVKYLKDIIRDNMLPMHCDGILVEQRCVDGKHIVHISASFSEGA